MDLHVLVAWDIVIVSDVFQDEIITKQKPSSQGFAIMEKNEDAPKKETKFQRFNRFIALKGAPYEALLLAIALSLPLNVLLPYAGFSAMLNKQWALGLLVGLCAILLFYELSCLCGNIIMTTEKWPTPWKWPNRILEVIALVLFSPLGIMIIAWLGVKKSRPWAVFTSIAGLILFLYAQFTSMEYLPLRPLALLLAASISPLFVMAAIVSVGGLKLRQKIVSISFAIVIVSGILRMATEYPVIRHLTEAPAKMETLLADYRQTHGIDVQPCDESLLEKEPLKNVVSLMQALEKQFVWEQSISNTYAGIQKQYADISKKSEGVRDAIIALTAIPPHPVTPTQPFAESSHPFPNSLAEAARFLAIEMMANAQQRDLVKQDNAAMISLRDWCLQQESNPLDKSFGRRIEGHRLGALARTLPQNRYSEKEWLELLGDEPDWRYFAACAYKIDADSEYFMHDPFNFNEAFDDMGPMQFFCKRWMVNSLYYGVNCIPFSFGSSILIRFFIDPAANKQKTLAEFVSLSLDENSTMDEARKLDATHKTYENPILFLKPGIAFYSMPYYIQDARQMAMLSWKIMEYSHEHNGVLPENLAQINETPVSALNNLPFVYEHGDIEILSDGGDSINTIRGFRLFIPDEEHASKPNWKKIALGMDIPLE